jgi:O-methyltransferase
MKRAISEAIDLIRLNSLFRKYRPYSMIKRRAFLENLLLVKETLDKPELSGGAVIECGTWKGGMAAAIVEIGGPKRPYLFFDSFEGLPPADEATDGRHAIEYQASAGDPEAHNNCTASLSDIKAALALTGIKAPITIVPGFFEQSFPTIEPPPIAVLRLDADWYSSTMISLKKFWPHVLPGGLILIDDYYT